MQLLYCKHAMESKTYSVTGFYQVKNKLIVTVNKKCQEEVSGLGSFFVKGMGLGSHRIRIPWICQNFQSLQVVWRTDIFYEGQKYS